MEVPRSCKVFLLLLSLSGVYAQNNRNRPVRQYDNANNRVWQNGAPVWSNRPHFRYGNSTNQSGSIQNIDPPVVLRPTPSAVSSGCKEQLPRNILLTFSNMGFRRIGDDFVRSEDATLLRLNMNMIDQVSPMAFRSMARLEELDLSANKIPASKLLRHANCPRLRTLILDENKPNVSGKEQYVIKSYLEPLLALRRLSLRRNQIVDLHLSLAEFAPSLSELNLSQNNITDSHFLEDLPKSLTHLHLDDNAIRRVEQGVARNLVVLSMNGNKIEQLCGDSCDDASLSLENASTLQDLRVSRNSISDIAENTFRHTPRLFYLDLSQNKIKALPENAFHGLADLQHLHLGYNHLISIPNLCPLIGLKLFNFTDNNIVGVRTDSFCSRPMLQTLLLSANRIMTIEERAFNALSRLETLDLSDNLITKLPVNWLRPPNSLQRLLLNNNDINNLDNLSNITQISTLEHLHLEGNPLYEVRISSLLYYPRNLAVHLTGKLRGNVPADLDDHGDDDDDNDDGDDHGNDDDDFGF